MRADTPEYEPGEVSGKTPNYGNAHVDLIVKEAVAAARERCAKAAEWFSNVEKFTAAQVAARIRSSK